MPSKGSKRVAAAPKVVSAPPSPFTVAPTVLNPLLDVLDYRYVYIVHIDTHPAAYKKRIFLIPIVLNAIFAVLILLRVYYAVPKYLSILVAMLGYGGADAVNTKKERWRALVWLVMKRGMMLLGDWLLLRVVASWPYTFFLEGPDNACTWRWKCGTRDREVIVRSSRTWGTQELMQGNKKGDESPFWRTKVLPAITPQWMREKTGYLMMGKDWDLDFPAMVVAQKALDRKELTEGDVDRLVFAWQSTEDDNGEWLTWSFKDEAAVPAAPTTKDEYGQTEEEGMQQMHLVRDKLASIGKESLFFRMIELAQYEGSVPGRSPQERERITVQEVQKLFSADGVDFAKLMEELDLEWPGLAKPS